MAPPRGKEGRERERETKGSWFSTEETIHCGSHFYKNLQKELFQICTWKISESFFFAVRTHEPGKRYVFLQIRPPSIVIF